MNFFFKNKTSWKVFSLFATFLLLKTLFFSFEIYDFSSPSFLKTPVDATLFWGGKIAPILFFSSFIFFSKKQYWTIIIHTLIDVWCICNWIYFRANSLFLSVDAMLMVDNMNGFWDSILTFLSWELFIFPLSTIIYCLILIHFKLQKTTCRNWKLGFVFLVLFYGTTFLNNKLYERKFASRGLTEKQWCDFSKDYHIFSDFHLPHYNPYHPFAPIIYTIYAEDSNVTYLDFDKWMYEYVKFESIIHCFPAIFIQYYLSQNNNIQINSEDDKTISSLIQPQKNHTDIQPKGNVVYILVESLESWTLDEIDNFDYLPNIKKLLENEHILYCKKIKSQVKHGVSADGQMINLTGLLPISTGAACRIFANNTYPNYVHFFKKSAIINPCPGIWNQPTMTKRYGFKDLIEKKEFGQYELDETVFEKTKQYVENSDSTFCVLAITATSHTPFEYGKQHKKHQPKDMPEIMSNYLNCLAYTDSCIGILLNTIFNSHLKENTTIVITGDHTIFKESPDFDNMTEYAQSHEISFQNGKNHIPLIIYSPHIKQKTVLEKQYFQMDIYPTVLNLIGCENYYWHGLGINLLDSTSRENRKINENEAFRLSNLIIRNNYFNQLN